MTMTGIDILERAKVLFTEKGWVKAALAKNADGHPLSDPHDPSAASYCLLGGLIAASGCHDLTSPYSDAWRALQRQGDLVEFNNAPETTLEDVLERLDIGIAHLKEQVA